MINNLENYFRENLANVLQTCQIAHFLIFSEVRIANVQLYYHSLFYNKLNSMKQSQLLVILQNYQIVHCQIFLGEDALNPHTSPWLQYYYFSFYIVIYKNIICEFFKIKFMQVHYKTH